ncbi:hypothetical protein [Effusibacillus dendaii]|uniref:Uncharacterized protein n=1 Tax=Effusibacillus dendaii TaxID=2743772 RepID=A0A7I8D4V4_9BACL|nr:hypothetical protein [Effusibacillus dendaii]BCJ85105.1 hypothetical protein skT53_00900 [Effusibacillus dendaii]
MGDLYVHVGGPVNQDDLQRVENVLPEIEGDETLTVLTRAENTIQTDTLLDLLDQRGFKHYTKSGPHNEFKIIARRKH